MHVGTGAALLAFLTIQRLAECGLAKRNEARLRAAGGVEYGAAHLPLMVLLHTAWLVGLWALAYHRSVDPLFFGLFVMLQMLRLWVLLTLGRRWTIRIIAVAGEPLVRRGPYRFMRHPNYAAVAGEMAVVFSLLNAAMMAVRIPKENAALASVLQ
jgi:methyltransferase